MDLCPLMKRNMEIAGMKMPESDRDHGVRISRSKQERLKNLKINLGNVTKNICEIRLRRKRKLRE